MKTLHCTPENISEFNAELRRHQDMHAFVKALHGAGMIDGLGGARIGPAGSLPDAGVAVRPVLSDAAEARHADAEWAKGDN